MTISPQTRAAGPVAPPAGARPDEPVFVDASGRRQRLVRRAGRLLVIPAAGYLALLLSSLLGGPSVDAPFLPQQHAERPPTPTVPAAPAAGTTADGPSAEGSARPAGSAGQTAAPSRSARPAGAPSPSAAPVTAPPEPTAPVTTGPTAGPGNPTNSPGHGRPSTAPSRKPSKNP
ncbi:hypothetical protein ACIA8O_34195 [Kitasatospora sp. NPDC051853]|uniref:hypothetical protein n=1 Tax=Kitasatospora sp. NPDC051853 TaxID=3364058 RepID=UPI0037A4B329